MNTIIVPTDFSRNAQVALDFAINIANHFDAKIHLIHSYEVHSRAGMMISLRDYIRTDAEESLGSEVSRVKTHLLRHTALEAKAIEGNPVDLICTYAEQFKADLIVMGTKGASGLKKIFMGSITAGLIDQAKNPVMAIPEEATYRPFQKITLALDITDSNTIESMRLLMDLSKAYKSILNILHVEKKNAEATQPPEAGFYCPPIPHAYYTIENNNVLEGIDEFLNQHQTDLLVMIHNERKLLDRIFNKSKSKEKAMNTTLPLLVIPHA